MGGRQRTTILESISKEEKEKEKKKKWHFHQRGIIT